MPRLDPRAGEGRVVDQAHLGEAGQDRGGCVLGQAVAVHGLGQLSPGPRPPGEQSQAELRACSSGSLTWPEPACGPAWSAPTWPGPGPSGPGWAAVTLAARSGTAAYASRRPRGPACGRTARCGPGRRSASSRPLAPGAPAGAPFADPLAPAPAAGAASASMRGPTPSFSLIFFSISFARSGLSRRKFAGVLLALAELVAFVGVPGSRLANDGLLDPQVDQPALAANSGPENDVALGDLERRGALVLDHLDPGPAAHGLGAVLQRLDPAHVEPHRRVELERPPAAWWSRGSRT